MPLKKMSRLIVYALFAALIITGERSNAAPPAASAPTPGVPLSRSEKIPELSGDAALARVAGTLAEHIRPAVIIDADVLSGKSPTGRSRIGGLPDLPADLHWPQHGGRPMSFLAQLNLGGLPRSIDEVFPGRGMLWFFYDVEGGAFGIEPSDRGSWAVLYRAEANDLNRREPPRGLTPFPECALDFRFELTLLETEAAPLLVPDLNRSELDRYSQIFQSYAEGHDLGGTQLFGNPFPIQNDIRTEAAAASSGVARLTDAAGRAAAREWRLLLQLDSEGCAQMMWGDSGMLYFMIKDEDLRAHRFDRSWMVMQCF